MSQFHVNQIETHLREKFAADHWCNELDESNNLSRLLALRGLELILGGGLEETGGVVEITDGTHDHGIDAVGVDPTTKVIVFVQSKWRQGGGGSMSLADVLKFLDGVRALLGMKGEGEPAHASQETREAVHALLRTPGARVRLVTATTASDPLAPDVEAPITALLAQLNDLEDTEPLATHAHLGQAEFFNALADKPAASVDLQIQMQDWGRSTEPMRMYYGRVIAADIAQWHNEHGTDLFAENIRVVIPRSEINQGILNTVRDEPDRLGYYNNGITIIAQSVELGPGGALNKEVGYFKLTGASVVNGAQTVSTVARAIGTDFQANLGSAFVLVRVIEVPADETNLAHKITRYANTQNEVSSQDFAFLDEQQHRLVKELSVIGFEYVVRSAEIPKTDNPDKVIEVRQAAVALACASPNLSHAVTAKREFSLLFSSAAIYKSLFNPNTDALALARSVQVMRAVDRRLDEMQSGADGIAAGVAIHGRRAVLHVILQDIGDAALRDPAFDFDAALREVPQKAFEHAEALIDVFPDNSYPGNVFKNLARCSSVLSDAGLG